MADDSAYATGPKTICPHCDAVQPEDIWEVLLNDTLHDFVCSTCCRPFFFETRECLSCGHETSTSWKQKPTVETQNSTITCGGCGKRVPSPNTQADDSAFFDDAGL